MGSHRDSRWVEMADITERKISSHLLPVTIAVNLGRCSFSSLLDLLIVRTACSEVQFRTDLVEGVCQENG